MIERETGIRTINMGVRAAHGHQIVSRDVSFVENMAWTDQLFFMVGLPPQEIISRFLDKYVSGDRQSALLPGNLDTVLITATKPAT